MTAKARRPRRFLLPGVKRSPGAVQAEINVTPLVDVVLVLLIIFMVITPYLQQGIDVELPIAEHSTAAQARADDALVVSIAGDGTVYLGTDRVSVRALVDRLRPLVRADPDREILLKADATVHFREVRQVMTALRNLGANGLSLATAEEEDGGS
jgi:biopolymer transport protein ExbD/biopolymer transport protein TolR